MILHHTDCGILRLTDYPEQLAAFFEIPAEELDSKAVADPYAAVRVDTAIARRTLPASRLVPGLVYDVNTGLIELGNGVFRWINRHEPPGPLAQSRYTLPATPLAAKADPGYSARTGRTRQHSTCSCCRFRCGPPRPPERRWRQAPSPAPA